MCRSIRVTLSHVTFFSVSNEPGYYFEYYLLYYLSESHCNSNKHGLKSVW